MPNMDFSTENKVCIRTHYNKQVIKFLKEEYGYFMVYFGLPAPEAYDIECWIEYLDYIIAFQCRNWRSPSHPDQSREAVDQLTEKLSNYEVRKQIKNYVVYDGYIEEVIFRGYDNSYKGQPFIYDKYVTVFNLDFCNKISSPQFYTDINGTQIRKYKVELIDKILDLQYGTAQEGAKFVLFVTFNADYNGEELSNFINGNANLIEHYSSLPIKKRKRKILRLYIENIIFQTIKSNGFIPQFLPTIEYRGIGDTPMFQFAVLCVKPTLMPDHAPIFYQSVEEVVNRKAIKPNSEHNGFEMVTYRNIEENNVNLDFLEDLIDSENFNNHWR